MLINHPAILAQATTVTNSPVLTQTTGATFSSTVNGLMNLINALVWLLAIVAVAVFLYGVVRFVAKAGDTHAHATGYKMMMWGLVALFVLFSLGGLIAFLNNALFSTGPANSNTPGITVCNASGCGSV